MSKTLKEWEALDVHGEIAHLGTMNATNALSEEFRKNNPATEAQKRARAAEWEAALLNSKPDSDYQGPHLKFPLTHDQVDSLALHFAKKWRVPLHDSFQCKLLVEARALLASLPRVQPLHSKSGQHQKLIVVGDLHGQLADLLTIFIENGFPSPNGVQYLFNGDFVDRGKLGVEVMTLLLAYKVVYPDSVHLNRGNHETISMNMNYGFTEEILTKFDNAHMLDLVSQVWDLLPVCSVLDDKVFVIHGGLPRVTGATLAQLESVPRAELKIPSSDPHMMMLVDALWSDPQPEPGQSFGVRGEGTSMFGPDITQAFLEANKLELVVRSHQVPSTNRGYEVLHNNMVITVFSASNYCGTQGNHAGLVVFDGPGNYRFKEFVAPDLAEVAHRLEPFVEQEMAPRTDTQVFELGAKLDEEQVELKAWMAICEKLQELITERHDDLKIYYAGCDQLPKGCISQEDWISGLAAALKLEIDFADYQESLVQLTEAGTVDWRKFLRDYQVNSMGRAGDWVVEMKQSIHDKVTAQDLSVPALFKLFDHDGDGRVSPEELVTSMKEFGMDLATSVLKALIPGVGEDGKVDLMDFIAELRPSYAGAPPSPAVAEVMKVIESTMGQSPKDILLRFAEIDKDRDGVLDFNELSMFLEWLGQQNSSVIDPDTMKQVFDVFDDNKSGTVSIMEFLDRFKSSAEPLIDQLVTRIARSIFKHKGSLKQLFFEIDVNGVHCGACFCLILL